MCIRDSVNRAREFTKGVTAKGGRVESRNMREDGDGVASLGVRASRRAYRLNIVEIFFSILIRRMLRRGEFASRQDLADKILKVHRGLQPDRRTLPLVLRRQAPQGGVNPRRINAVLH